MPLSSSGLGRQPLTLEITGSIPVRGDVFYYLILYMQKKPRFQRNKTGQNQIYINEKIKAFNIMLVAEGNEEQATIPRAKALRIAEEA